MADCFTCPSDQNPNKDQTSCIPKVVVFLSYEEPLGIAFAICALFLSLVTGLVLRLFVKHHNSPIVQVNNRSLTYTLLISLLLCFLCPLLHVGRPEKVICIFRHLVFRAVFTITVFSVFAKTVTVVLAFMAAQPGSTLKNWLGKRLAMSIILLYVIIEAVICTVQLTMFPPTPEADIHSSHEEIILGCKQSSLTMTISEMIYWWFLAISSFIVAFLARKLPSTFNEAKFISFSMVVFCCVWLVFLPVLLTANGKIRSSMKIIFMLASSAVFLVLMIFPKCYIILWRPELNSREQLRKWKS